MSTTTTTTEPTTFAVGDRVRIATIPRRAERYTHDARNLDSRLEPGMTGGVGRERDRDDEIGVNFDLDGDTFYAYVHADCLVIEDTPPAPEEDAARRLAEAQGAVRAAAREVTEFTHKVQQGASALRGLGWCSVVDDALIDAGLAPARPAQGEVTLRLNYDLPNVPIGRSEEAIGVLLADRIGALLQEAAREAEQMARFLPGDAQRDPLLGATVRVTS
jgi:hypothetical protein